MADVRDHLMFGKAKDVATDYKWIAAMKRWDAPVKGLLAVSKQDLSAT
jgi:hypothetical protein